MNAIDNAVGVLARTANAEQMRALHVLAQALREKNAALQMAHDVLPRDDSTYGGFRP